MPQFVWIALALFVAGFVVGGSWLAFNALRAWRRGWPVARQLAVAVEELGARTYVLDAKIVELEPRVTELQRSTTSLAASVAQAKLLLGVMAEAKVTFDRARLLLRFL